MHIKTVGQLLENGEFFLFGTEEYKINVLSSPENAFIKPRIDEIERWLEQGINGAIRGLSCHSVMV